MIRAANQRTLRDIHHEIRRIQVEPSTSAQRSGLLIRLSPLVPGLVRRLFLRSLRKDPLRGRGRVLL